MQGAASYNVASHPVGLAATDLNGDGKYDIVNIDHNTAIGSILLSNGNGTLREAVNIFGVA
ncbi:hypothetical protein [Candidatus Midichloria mitochondrii]|uniref:hypothetical protein n=1 Tax=Candidatus Midichloria mitochondrii TaxID=234827 RepID=UPI0002F4B247|nr:hypothetical protein [Candidatus Midichloria mitochondrii]